MHPLRILSWCIMSNHWHFVVWPRADGEVTDFFRWLTHTHAMRWRVARRTVGYGHLYQGRFKCFPVQEDAHFLTVCRYVERNALTSGLVGQAQEWRWSSLWARTSGAAELEALLAKWPVSPPRDWLAQVNKPISPKELERVRLSVQRDRPLGSEAWLERTAARLGLKHTIRREGRPRKDKAS